MHLSLHINVIARTQNHLITLYYPRLTYHLPIHSPPPTSTTSPPKRLPYLTGPQKFSKSPIHPRSTTLIDRLRLRHSNLEILGALLLFFTPPLNLYYPIQHIIPHAVSLRGAPWESRNLPLAALQIILVYDEEIVGPMLAIIGEVFTSVEISPFQVQFLLNPLYFLSVSVLDLKAVEQSHRNY